MIRRLAIMFMLLAAPEARAQVPIDTLARTPLQVSEETLARLRADDRFVYEEEARVPEGESLWSILMRTLQRLFEVAAHPNGRPLQYGLLALLAFWLIVKIARMEPASAMRRAAAQIRGGTDMPEDIGARRYLQEARQARAVGDTRLAVRYLFLHVLQRLADTGRVTYRAEKTNRAYLREMGERLRPVVTPFVRAFETSWYGGVAPTEAAYDALEADCTELESKLVEADAG